MAQLDVRALTAYLNEHLAGSVAGLDLMERLCRAEAAAKYELPLTRIKSEVEDEQALVRQFIADLGGSESVVAKAAAWMSEKVTAVMLGAGDRANESLRLFEALEALSLGFWGRRSLWKTLGQLQEKGLLREAVRCEALARRADRHLEELEEIRLRASLDALTQMAVA